LNDNYLTLNFLRDGEVLNDAPLAGMTLLKTGSMRFRWNEDNPNRNAFLDTLSLPDKKIAAVELIHSHTVYAVDDASELHGLQGDGIISLNKNIIPVITAADCMPILIYDPVTKVFGALHSGWKGTGIVCDAIALASKKYGANAEDFCVIMAPHIHDCCYFIEEDRASFFAQNFTPDCVSLIREGENAGKYALSLADANLAALKKIGVPQENIVTSSDCTCCKKNPDGSYKFGSFRRQTSSLPPSLSLEERQKLFTVQAAWVKW